MLSLKQKLAMRLTALLVAIALIGAISAWGFLSLRDRYDRAEEQYALLRAIYTIGHHADTARTGLMRSGEADAATQQALRQAITIAGGVLDETRQPVIHLTPDQRQTIETISKNLSEASAADRAGATPRLAATLFEVAKFSTKIENQIVANRKELTDQLETTLQTVVGLVAMVMAIAVAISVAQYLGVAQPLQRLGEGVRRLSAARFEETKIKPAGDREFVELAETFNQMADELGGLYASLEHRIQTQSQELVRSEQMAGVGYLAAGVAHEINNPLGIISGYAEEASEMAQKLEGQSAEQIDKSLHVIAEEAFRCKGIIQQLLNLAAPNSPEHGPVDMADILEQIAEVLRGLKIFKDQRLKLNLPGHDGLAVTGNANELKQVMLNLLTNALEAVDPEGGQVTVDAKCENGRIHIDVRDNGGGMSPDILAHVFEPFFTRAKQPGGRKGTGLGLSVSQSIVQDHGGTLRAHSDGEGHGATFRVELPEATA